MSGKKQETGQVRRKKKKPVKKRFHMVVCWVTSIKNGYVILRPMMKNIGIKGSVTCSFENIKDKEIPNIGKEVSAFNIHEVDKGWRAESIKTKKI